MPDCLDDGRPGGVDVSGAEPVDVLERAWVAGEAGLGQRCGFQPQRAAWPTCSGLQSVPKFALIPLAIVAAMARAAAVRSVESPRSLAAAAAAPIVPSVPVACQPTS